jgi:predicted RNA-binding Zn-ribbon protein involved in translation (DUF1610 family)
MIINQKIFWIGATLFSLAILRMLFGVFAWALAPEGEYTGAFAPELIACNWIREQIKYILESIEELIAGLSSRMVRRKNKALEKRERENEARISDKQNLSDSHSSALVYCPDCGSKVSRRAESCPECGAPGDVIRHAQTLIRTQSIDEKSTARDEQELIRYFKKERRRRRGNTQGCGCLVVILSILLFIIFPLAGIILIIFGLILLIIGFLL